MITGNKTNSILLQHNIEITIHSSLMIVGWLLCITSGIFTSRYLKRFLYTDNWRLFYKILQVLGLICITSSFTLIVYTRGIDNISTHGVVGFIIVIGLFASGLLGIITEITRNPNRIKAALFPTKIHRWLGRTVLLAAFINIYLGFIKYHLFDVYPHGLILTISYTLWLLLAVFVTIREEFRIKSWRRSGFTCDINIQGIYDNLEQDFYIREDQNKYRISLFVYGTVHVVLVGLLVATLISIQLLVCSSG
eukprot:TRINITY_DN5642_c0_g2_i1.p1 TRINITY_DN5642_c0_g2~~TRINITY_DN5642_c0_g2_i1.p1  ORF type:complete len:250 (-),score=4.20 TRINITY_DN5642_c0_g2_i1:140-889(-)